MITLTGGMTSVVYGLADIGFGYLDAQQGYVGAFKTVTDWGRVGAVVGGLAIDYKLGGWTHGAPRSKLGEIGAPLFYSGLPLLFKSVKNAAGLKATPAARLRSAATRTGGMRLAEQVRRNVPLSPNGNRAL